MTRARFGALDLHVDTKPDLTPVTDADRAVETEIRAALGRERPDDSILGEEFGEPPSSAGGSG
ncbi:inositol monophosphatase family protein [Mycobacterium kansasii]|uniref:Inositol monophosphatase family protein n=1 Tax=Mycobacterium kansasii TaxID=1768 RepID=A0A1V3XUD5_MYCKA|nr:inositol monophosphatase family protein [Mycobacterium kansasii]